MKFEISGTVMQTVAIDLDPGEQIYSQTNTMAWMNDAIVIDTHTGSGFLASLKRSLTGGRLVGTPCPLHLVRVGVPLGQEPLLARPAEPPLPLRPPHVAAEVDVLVQLAHARRLLRPRRALTRTAQLRHLTRAAVGARHQHAHTKITRGKSSDKELRCRE